MKGNRGFGLIGLIVGVAILLIALTMAASAFYSASRLTRQAATYSVASNFAEGVMERLMSRPYDAIRTTEIKDGLPELPESRCLVSVTSSEPGIRTIVVTYSWREGARPRQVRFSTLIAKGGRR